MLRRLLTGKSRWSVLGSGVTALVVALTAGPAYGQYFVTQWGGFGTDPGEFNLTSGVATDSAGNVYVADELNSRVQKFTASGEFITQWPVEPETTDGPPSPPPNPPGATAQTCAECPPPAPTPENHPSELPRPPNGPYGIDADSAGNVYVTIGAKVRKFTSAGEFITEWRTPGEELFNLSEVATDAAGNVYVSDGMDDRVEVFTASGDFVTAWGSFGLPRGIAVDSAGSVYVVDDFAGLVQKFTSSGEFITQWGGNGRGKGEFVRPRGVDVDSAGNVYVGDLSRVQKFTSSGEFITQWGGLGAGAGEFCVTHDLAVDSGGNVFVSDAYHRIQKFSPTRAAQTGRGAAGPVPGVRIGICNAEGVVKVKCKGDEKFRGLLSGELIPVGCLVDARRGSVKLTSAQGGGRTQSGVFEDGVFRVDQRKGRNARVTLTLTGGGFRDCGGTNSSVSETGDAAGRRLIRRLRSRARGRFRTRGRYSSATVRGTVWTMTDRCDGTLTKVIRGTVLVRDFRRKRTIEVEQGKSYLARAPD